MTKSKSTTKRALDSYTIKGTNKAVKVGDCVVMRAQDPEKPPYVARVEKIESDHRNHVKVRVRWYYRPEESIGGRRQFHGAKELFLSDHYDVQSADTIEGKCTVHTFKNYTKLDSVESEDYFCRFEYKAATGGFTPDRVAVYCKCEMPYNPDVLMVQCEACKDCRNTKRTTKSCKWRIWAFHNNIKSILQVLKEHIFSNLVPSYMHEYKYRTSEKDGAFLLLRLCRGWRQEVTQCCKRFST